MRLWYMFADSCVVAPSGLLPLSLATSSSSFVSTQAEAANYLVDDGQLFVELMNVLNHTLRTQVSLAWVVLAVVFVYQMFVPAIIGGSLIVFHACVASRILLAFRAWKLRSV
jgi:hypothetical protein